MKKLAVVQHLLACRKYILAALRFVPWLVVFISFQAQAKSQAEIASYIDGLMQYTIDSGQAVGATISIVKDGRILVLGGYGHADLENGQIVEPRETTFRIGSITKVLNWMAVLQLVESGRLDLDTDINNYLSGFKIDHAFADPITLRHLMTHTAGFEDDIQHLFVGGARQLGTLEGTLAKSLPRRIIAPGSEVAYSNFGTAVAGHIVANMTNQSWHDYVDTHVLAPLRMSNSSTQQPLPENLQRTRSVGYLKQGNEFVPKGFAFIPFAPAGSASATAFDMARLMVELLNPASSGVLSAKSKELMLNGAYVIDPALNAMTLGMYQMRLGQERAVGHDGSTILFNSKLILWPDHDVGLFVSFNSSSSARVPAIIANGVAELLQLKQSDDTKQVAQVILEPELYTGVYASLRRNFSNYTKLLSLQGQVTIEYDRIPDLLLVHDGSGTRKFKSVSDNVFEQLDGDARMAFRGLGTTKQTLYFNSTPMFAFDKLPSKEVALYNGIFLVAWLLCTLSVLVLWPIVAVSRRYLRDNGNIILSTIVWISGIVLLAFVVAFSLTGDGQYEFLVSGVQKVELIFWMPTLFCVLVVLQLGYLYRVWVMDLWWLSRRIHFTLMLFLNGVMAVWLWQWNLLPASVLSAISF